MESSWIETLFGTKKPIIGMCHFDALPGDPGYDREAGLSAVVEHARTDLRALQDGGVDAVMFSNEFSLPYMTKVEPVTTATMARIIGEISSDIRIPFGVNVLWDATASIDLAAATGAAFVREIFTGVYGSDFGLWNTNCGEAVRHRARVHADGVKLLFNIVPEGAYYLADRDVASIARSTMFNTRPDALCVSGLTAGAITDAAVLRAVKEAVPDAVVFANTGVNIANVESQLQIADGAVVGTAFKQNGEFENHVDQSRVAQFMQAVGAVRAGLIAAE
ncbi:MAG: SgcQ protein [Spirochaetaceae bacterium]|nr:MAG: SgcQ protein [Spirochaetaceae bacterium]